METVGHTFPFHSLDRRGHHRYHRTIRNVAGRFRIGGGKGNSATWRRGEGSRWRIKIFRDPTRDELRVSAIYPIKSLTVFHFRFSHRSKTHSSFRSSSFILRYLDSISLSLSLEIPTQRISLLLFNSPFEFSSPKFLTLQLVLEFSSLSKRVETKRFTSPVPLLPPSHPRR